MVIPVVAALSEDVQNILMKVVKPKFASYFTFTSSASGGMARSVRDPGGQPWFTYPNHTMIPDLVFLWSLFSDVYEAVGGPGPFADLVKADPYLQSHIRRIVEGTSRVDPDGSFWKFPGGHVLLQHAIDGHLSDVLRTMRNGFAHSHWFHADLNAADYWKELGWDTAGADPLFNLPARPKNNYTIYIADARDWDPQNFWTLTDLRILVTHSHILRYHLHLLLNFLLTGSKDDVFRH
jgi:hypothetical protein